ncbi:MAG: hypothetical protein ABR552_06745 [Actinomycetota bacterium]
MKSSVNWYRVGAILRAREPDAMVRCPSCNAQGVVPYIAEHVLTVHPTSPAGGQIRKAVAGKDERSA